jgi:hypothetical protein
MTAIVRCIPLDSKTQVGFYGTDQEILQQQREAEEGYLLSRRWISSSLPHETPTFHFENLEQLRKKKRGLCSLGFDIQTAGATANSLSRIVDEE